MTLSVRHRIKPPEPFTFRIDRHLFRLAPEAVTTGAVHSVEPVSFLAPQYSTSPAQISYADVNRVVEIPIAQNDFSDGHATKVESDATNSKAFRYSKGMDTSGPPGTIFPGPAVSTIGAVIDTKPTKAVQKGNFTYVAAGTKLYQITDQTTRTLDTTFADAITDLVFFNDKLVVGFGESAATNMSYRVSNTIAGAFTDCGVKAEFMTVVQNNPIGPVFYRSISHQIAAATDVLSTSVWVSFNVGDTAYAITSLTPFQDHLIVGKQDGPYVFTTDYISFPLDRTLRLQAFASIAQAAYVYNGAYYFNSRHSLWKYDGKSITQVGMDLLADPQVPGGAFAPDNLVSDGRFLYAMHSQAYVPPANVVAGSYIFKLDRNDRWHSYLWRSDLGTAQTAPLLLATPKLGSVDFTNAILFAYSNSTNWQLAWAPFPSVEDPTKDSAYRFDTTGTAKLRTCDFTGGLATTAKYTDRIKVVADHLTATGTVDAYAYVDNDAAVKLASFKKSPNQEQYLSSPKNYLRMSVEFFVTGATALAATVQQIRGFEFPLRFLSRVTNHHTVRLVAMDALPLATGGVVSPRGGYSRVGNWKTIVEDLRFLRKTRAAVDVVDEDGRQFNAYLVDVAEQTVHPRDGGGPTKVLTVTMYEVALS